MPSPFIPPYPPRPDGDQSDLQTLFAARRDLLSFWNKRSFSNQFMFRTFMNRSIAIVNTPELVKTVLLTRKENYESKSRQMEKALEPLLGDGLFISDGMVWKQRRALQNNLFDQQHVRGYSAQMVAATSEFAGRWDDLPQGSSVKMLPAMGQLTSEIISRTLFGTSLGSKNALTVVRSFAKYQAAIEQIHLGNFLGIPDWVPSHGFRWFGAQKAAKRIHSIVDEVIASGKQTESGTLLAQLLAAKEDGEAITKDGIRNELIVLFMAGHETTANTLAWFWYLLSQAPEVEAKLHQEVDEVLGFREPNIDDIENLPYVRACIEETLRLYPPVPILSRRAKEDDEIRQTKIPAGSLMLVVPWLLHRHQNYWDNPDAFMPERFMPNNKRPDKFLYVPFSVGPRVCMGKLFGLVESVLVVASLAQKFRFQLPMGTRVGHECRLTLRPKGDLAMRLQHRNFS